MIDKAKLAEMMDQVDSLEPEERMSILARVALYLEEARYFEARQYLSRSGLVRWLTPEELEQKENARILSEEELRYMDHDHSMDH